MIIGIDAHYAGLRFGGNESLSENLVNALGQLHSNLKYNIYVNNVKQARTRINEGPALTIHRLWPPSVAFQRACTLPWLAHRHGVRVLHVPFIIPPIRTCRVIVAIHDLAFEQYPQHFTGADLFRMKLLVRWSAKHADHIVTLSTHAQQDIQKIYEIPPDKITVVPAGVEPSVFRPVTDHGVLEEVRRQYHLPNRFILFVGTIQPRKNLPRLIKAFNIIARDRAIPHHLVLAGRYGWLVEETLASVEASDVRDRIHLIGPVANHELPALYNLADVFVFPSLFEGFGMPLLEAMACGTVVVTSNTSSLPEVVGDTGIVFNPEDTEDMASALQRVLNQPDLRENLAIRGMQRAHTFSWNASAKQMQNLYHNLIHQTGG